MTTNTFHEYQFPVSRGALAQLADEARIAGGTLGRRFRHRAAQMLTDPNPQFNISAAETERTLLIGMYRSLSDRLYYFAAKRGIPPVALGEMVAAYVVQEANA